jgi:hypothetical protein
MPIAVMRTKTIARPLKILIPLIQGDLTHLEAAGLEYALAAGAKLLEAKPQVSYGSWGRWLTKNFALSQKTARRYMRAAEVAQERGSATSGKSLLGLLGETDQRREGRATHRKAWSPFKDTIADVDVDAVAQARQSRTDEITLHRDLALELIDIGYKALATRLHPDRGGSREAMTRLNRVRDELKEVAQTRRFV